MISLFSSMDTAVGNYFQSIRTPGGIAFFNIVTTLGNIEVVFIVFGVALLVLLRLHKRREAIALACVVILSEGITFFAKNIFHRARPLHALIVETDYSFPSGHATIAVALYGFIAVLLFRHFKNTYARIAICVVASALILLIGISRLYLGVHYATDIIAGYVVGMVGCVIGWIVLNKK